MNGSANPDGATSRRVAENSSHSACTAAGSKYSTAPMASGTPSRLLTDGRFSACPQAANPGYLAISAIGLRFQLPPNPDMRRRT